MPRNLIVFSHLPWNFVYQRPQHVLSRMAKHYRVLFVEEPVSCDGEAELGLSSPLPGVQVCSPRTPARPGGFHDAHVPKVRELLERLLRDQQIHEYAMWFYTPMAMPFAQGLKADIVVYDCMDELSAFLGAPKELLQRERMLLRRADLVFTGGKSLYESKRRLHRSVHCFPSSVDAAHFAAARTKSPRGEATELPSVPRLGYYGVIDERIDLQLLAAVADARPGWEIVMVGPIVKIDPESAPRRPNIQYLGQRDYRELPALISDWDVCLMPFAINDATRYISPTKTLEYMAAGKPIVSTPITDVVNAHGDLVRIAANAHEFLEACDSALMESPAERTFREAAMESRVATTSWDTTVGRMQELLEEAHVPHAGNGNVKAARATFVASEGKRTGQSHQAVIVGAGPTGLSAAYHFGKGSVLLEQGKTVGGWCRSLEDNGFTFDYAGHIMFSHDPYVHQMYETLLGDNVHWQDREAWVYSKQVYTRYPFQGALYGLPPDVLKECLVGAIEARFGSIKADPRAVPAAEECRPDKRARVEDCCADGVTESTASLVAPGRALKAAGRKPENFEEFIYKAWGAGVAKHFAIPYNQKLWAVPLAEMETSWLGGRVPMPDLAEMIDGALRPVAKPVGPNARFGYPLRGGFQALMNGFLPLLEGELKLEAKVARVSPSRHEVVLADGSLYRYRQLISTAPLPRLIEMMGTEAPSFVRQAAARLRHVSVRCVNLGVARERVTDKHWIYYPEDTVFHRIFVQGNASPHCNPPGGFGLTCEITYSPSKPLPCEGNALIERCIADCVRTGLLRPDDQIIARNQVDLPFAYVVYDHARKESLELIRKWLDQHDVLLAGRYSEWEYYNSDHAFLAGRRAAHAAKERLGEGLRVEASVATEPARERRA